MLATGELGFERGTVLLIGTRGARLILPGRQERRHFVQKKKTHARTHTPQLFDLLLFCPLLSCPFLGSLFSPKVLGWVLNLSSPGHYPGLPLHPSDNRQNSIFVSQDTFKTGSPNFSPPTFSSFGHRSSQSIQASVLISENTLFFRIFIFD